MLRSQLTQILDERGDPPIDERHLFDCGRARPVLGRSSELSPQAAAMVGFAVPGSAGDEDGAALVRGEAGFDLFKSGLESVMGATLASPSAPVRYSSNNVVLFGVGPYERRNLIHALDGPWLDAWATPGVLLIQQYSSFQAFSGLGQHFFELYGFQIFLPSNPLFSDFNQGRRLIRFESDSNLIDEVSAI